MQDLPGEGAIRPPGYSSRTRTTFSPGVISTSTFASPTPASITRISCRPGRTFL